MTVANCPRGWEEKEKAIEEASRSSSASTLTERRYKPFIIRPKDGTGRSRDYDIGESNA